MIIYSQKARASMRSGKLAPGCLLMLTVGVVLLITTIIMLWVGNAQFQKIRSFTQTSPQWTEVVEVEGEEKEQLDGRIRQFIRSLDDAQEASLLLTPKELAQAIALYEPFEPSRSMITPREIVQSEDGRKLLRAEICFELNAMFPWQDKPYLIGTADMAVSTSLDQGGPRIEIVAVYPVEGEMPEQMIEGMNQMDPFLGQLRDPVRTPRGSAALEMIQFVEIASEGVILATSQEAGAKMGESQETRRSADIPVREK